MFAIDSRISFSRISVASALSLQKLNSILAYAVRIFCDCHNHGFDPDAVMLDSTLMLGSTLHILG